MSIENEAYLDAVTELYVAVRKMVADGPGPNAPQSMVFKFDALQEILHKVDLTGQIVSTQNNFFHGKVGES